MMLRPAADERTLGDLGEFALIQDFIVPTMEAYGFRGNIGDDCGFVLGLPLHQKLAITTDGGPRPILWKLEDHKKDYADAGWLSLVASASDIATSGGTPLAAVTCIKAPIDLKVRDLVRFVEGFAEACRAFGFEYAGGDIGEAAHFSSITTAVAAANSPVGRSGGCEGDTVVIVGPMGGAITAYLRTARLGPRSLHDELSLAVRRPRPRVQEMRLLINAGLVSSASDTSDGVLGALENLLSGAGLGAVLEIDDLAIDALICEEATAWEMSPWNLVFCWGDWSVVATIPSGRFDDFCDFCEDQEIRFSRLGRLVGDRQLVAQARGKTHPVTVVRNEHFQAWGFAHDFRAHFDRMLRTQLW